MDLYLYRIRVIRSAQESLFPATRSTSDILRTTFDRLRSQLVQDDKRLIIANVLPVSGNALFFKIGRSKSRNSEMIRNGEFVEVVVDEAASTDCFLDFSLGLLAMSKNPLLTRLPTALARKFGRMLTKVFETEGASFAVAAIQNPEGFLQRLERSAYIRSFFMSVSRPNPPDIDELITRPVERAILETDANRAHVELFGPDLDSEVITPLARSGAARGERVSAKIVEEQRIVHISLENSIALVKIRLKRIVTLTQARGVWERIMHRYERVRSGDEAE